MGEFGRMPSCIEVMLKHPAVQMKGGVDISSPPISSDDCLRETKNIDIRP